MSPCDTRSTRAFTTRGHDPRRPEVTPGRRPGEDRPGTGPGEVSPGSEPEIYEPLTPEPDPHEPPPVAPPGPSFPEAPRISM